MPQTFYIEADEEIISVIGRLRKSSEEENIFVFPKRALVLQSIVNLRLFQREAQKLGKTIVVVSQDEMGRVLAEKAGVKTKNYSEDFSQKSSHLELAPLPDAVRSVAPVERATSENGMLRSDSIGSADFNNSFPLPAPGITPLGGGRAPAPAEPVTLRVRNAAPPKLTSLNSQRVADVPVPAERPAAVTPLPAPAVALSAAQPVTPYAPFPEQQNNAVQPERGERLKNFYNGTRSESPSVPLPQKNPPQQATPIAGKKAHTIFFILGGVSVLSFAGVLAFLFLPKAEIHVTPYKVTQNVDIELSGRTDGSTASEEKGIAVRIIEKDKEVTLTAATTGKAEGVNQKARGSVVIYNNYSADPQSLVATTRLETADGKLFRLVSGVTVPGMTTKDGKKDPGVIEADVVADQAGEAYNIDPTTLRIPGFKGSAKYDTFLAKSTKVMVGGGNAGSSDVAVVAKVDLDGAEREAREKAKAEFLNEVQSELAPGEKVLDEQLDITVSSPATVPQVGTVANAFEYKNTFKFRAFIFSEKVVAEKVAVSSGKRLQEIKLKPVASTLTYSESVANFSEGILRLRAHAEVTMESDIDREALRTALLGQNEDIIQEVLKNFPEVKKIEVIFRPQWFIRSIPNAEDRVILLIEQSEEGTE